MRALLDTHTFLWYARNDSKLSRPALAQILDPSIQKLISPATYWEIAVKLSVGKLAILEPYDEFMKKGIEGSGFEILPILVNHTALVATLPFHHRDPFDRLLVAQALAEDVLLLSNDAALDVYGVRRVW